MPTQYKVSLKLADKTYSKSASSVEEALKELKQPLFFKTKGIMSVKAGKLKSETWMYPAQLRKLFINPMSKTLLAKRLTSALKIINP